MLRPLRHGLALLPCFLALAFQRTLALSLTRSDGDTLDPAPKQGSSAGLFEEQLSTNLFESHNVTECGLSLNTADELEEEDYWKKKGSGMKPQSGVSKLLHLKEEPLKLNGKPWCSGRLNAVKDTKKVAFVLTGESFRAKDFFSREKVDCTPASMPVQKALAENHMKQVVKPLEALGMKVHIYLSVIPCSQEKRKRLEPGLNFDNEAALMELYNASQVKQIFRFSREGSMYSRMADTVMQADEATLKVGTYEYFIFLRYDVFLDNPFTALIPKEPEVAHQGLSFFASAHDFMFGVPGEMWNCFVHFWDKCMRITDNAGIEAISLKKRKEMGCFNLGPVQLSQWAQGYAFDMPLRMIKAAVQTAWPGSRPGSLWGKTGTTAFDAQGRAHRCRSAWFWPPKSSWEHRMQPYYYHIGELAPP